MTRGTFARRYLRGPMLFGDWTLYARIDVFQDQRSGDFFARGGRQETYLIAADGGEVGPVTVWIDDDFLVDGVRNRTMTGLLGKIVDGIGEHFTMDDTERRSIIQAELVRQSRLSGVKCTKEFNFEIDIFESSVGLFATLVRKECYEVLPFCHERPRRLHLWSMDERIGSQNEVRERDAMRRIPLPPMIVFYSDNREGGLDAQVYRHIQDRYSLSRESMTVFVRVYQCLERIEIDQPEDDAEFVDIRISIDKRIDDGRLVASVDIRYLLEVNPIDDHEVAHVNLWAEDPRINNEIACISASSVDELRNTVVSRITEYYRSS